VSAVIVVGVFALITRGLHLDGLADTADGLASSYDRSKALTVMRRGDTGPTGLAAVVLVLLLQCAALTQVLAMAAIQTGSRFGFDTWPQVRPVAVVVAVAVAARLAIPAVCRSGVAAARPEGLGATVAGSVAPRTLGLVWLGTAVACSLLCWISGFDWWAGLAAVCAVTVTTELLVRRAVHRFGGITGDVIGMAVEIGTAAALLTLAAAASY
jgi:adenosylcobinamide-GDP ribazoletransferase